MRINCISLLRNLDFIFIWTAQILSRPNDGTAGRVHENADSSVLARAQDNTCAIDIDVVVRRLFQTLIFYARRNSMEDNRWRSLYTETALVTRWTYFVKIPFPNSLAIPFHW